MIHTKQFKAHRWAARFARHSPDMAFADAVRYLRECVALFQGKMSGEAFYVKTGHAPHTLRDS